jgi:mRNA interferase HigB
MHVFSHPAILNAGKAYPDAKTSLDAWFKIASRAVWTNIHEVRADFPHTDPVGTCVVFNIGGNKYRLITRIFYASEKFRGNVYVLHFLTHKDYDQEKWKKDCACE